MTGFELRSAGIVYTMLFTLTSVFLNSFVVQVSVRVNVISLFRNPLTGSVATTLSLYTPVLIGLAI